MYDSTMETMCMGEYREEKANEQGSETAWQQEEAKGDELVSEFAWASQEDTLTDADAEGIGSDWSGSVDWAEKNDESDVGGEMTERNAQEYDGASEYRLCLKKVSPLQSH